MNILISGGAGFIGSHLADALLKKGYSVVVADKLIFGSQNINHILENNFLIQTGKFKFYKYDLSIQKNVDTVFRENKIDVVFHLAANSDIRKGGSEPSIDFKNTFLTTKCLLEGMRKFRVKNLFFASTSAIYGEKPNISLKETTGGLEPISYYGSAKFASEAFISSYCSMNEMNAVIFRFPNVIGPRLTHGVIFDFLKKLQNNNHELIILGNGAQCKPYIYVSDLIDCICFITNKWRLGVNLFNVGVLGQGTTVTRIAKILIEEMGLRDVKLNYTGGERGWKGDVPCFSYDISKILATGWKPKFNSDEAVRQTIKDLLSSSFKKQ